MGRSNMAFRLLCGEASSEEELEAERLKMRLDEEAREAFLSAALAE